MNHGGTQENISIPKSISTSKVNRFIFYIPRRLQYTNRLELNCIQVDVLFSCFTYCTSGWLVMVPDDIQKLVKEETRRLVRVVNGQKVVN